MNLIIFILLIWGACAIINKVSARARENARQREIERMKAEQARQRMEQQRQREAIKQREREAREQARRQAEHDKAIARARMEREAMKKEQARQAAQLAKHDEMIANLTFRIQNAEHDIIHIQKQMDEYMPLLWRLDEEMQELDRQISIAQQMRKVDAVNRYQKEKDKVQRKIISLENNIHTAEKKLAKAQFIKAQATAKLSA